MNKLTIYLSLLVFLLSTITTQSYAQKNKVVFENLTFDQAMAQAAKTKKMIFVDVNRPVSPASNVKVEENIMTIDSIAKFFKDHCIAIRVDMNTEEGKKFAPRLAMLMYPVYVFYDKNGDQLSFISSGEILKDTVSLMQKARTSLATAMTKEVNTRHINFDSGNWKSVLAKAKKEGKMIFVDAYTTWCRPCIQMAKDIFTLDNVADYYNKNFVNVSMDMEKGDGPQLVKKYEIHAYPDFLFINGDGELIHRGGGYQEAKEFIQLGNDAVKALDKKAK
ncbi:MAG: thioredoxin family protein [Ginsengibacter sp.]